jgi:hypothetical protein
MKQNKGRKQRTYKRSQRGGEDGPGMLTDATNAAADAATDAATKTKAAAANVYNTLFGNSTPTQYSPTPTQYSPTPTQTTYNSTGGKKHKKKRGGSRKRKCKTRKRKTRKH